MLPSSYHHILEKLHDSNHFYFAKLLVNITDMESMNDWWEQFKTSSNLKLSKVSSKVNPKPSDPFISLFRAECKCRRKCSTYVTLYLQRMDSSREKKLYRKSNPDHNLVVKLYLTHCKY